ncbi:MAG TPA: YitT family protein [Synergistales bacterium]|nr:YitT family protein [Synergistales bacterium]HQQ10464.1 YitT family protein [Synergistales bacterium]
MKWIPRKTILRALSATRKELPTFALMTFGTSIVAFGIMSLTIPYRLPDSGVSGIAVLSNYAFGISPAWVVGVANIILLAWGMKELSVRFVGWTVYAVVLLTALLKLFEGIPYPHLDELLLVAILAGVVKGLGGGLVLRSGSSLGGTDILVVALRKRYGIEVGRFTFYINLVILGVSVFIVGLEGAIYGLVSIFVNGLVLDNVLRSFDRRRQVFVISNRPKEIADFIIRELHRGVTILHGEGGFTHEERSALLCVLTPRQTMDLKRFLSVNDPKAFMIVSDASEVLGRGFKSWTAL